MPFLKIATIDRLRALGFAISSAKEEEQDPGLAYARLEGAMDEVRRRAKQRKSRLVARENIGFGFVRNLLGIKPLAVIVSLLSAAAFVLFCWVRSNEFPRLTLPEYGLMSVLLFHLIGLVALVTPRLVEQHAEAYARALFEEVLSSSPS